MFESRREEFLKAIRPGVAILPSPPAPVKSNDVEHEYHQDSDLYYLTGFEEPGTVAVFLPGHAEHPFVLFVRPRDRELEIWNGRRAGPEGAVRDFGAKAAFPIDQLVAKLPELILNSSRIYYRMGRDPEMDRVVLGAMDEARRRTRKGGTPPGEIVDPTSLLHESRLLKSAEEIALLRKACEITCEAHTAAMRICRPGVHEYELEAEIEAVFRRRGSAGPGYPSIVGRGANATILHYIANTDRVGERDLVLVDAGCEWRYYNADVTRTFPASGRFSREQRELYDLVLEAQLAAIAEVRPGVPYENMHKTAVRVLSEGFVKLGLLSGDPGEIVETERFRRFYPHGTGHWLGLDVHDAGLYKLGDVSRPLAAGMVLTVEPGIYVQPDDLEAPEKYRGLGIRIEDDVLVTASGCDVLTAGAPKTAQEVEAAVGRA
jgi:Xaa-Pro aminopeptidase